MSKLHQTEETVELKEKEFIEINEHQVRKMSVIFKIYQKHFLFDEEIGKVFFGPFMVPTLENSTLTYWEKLILFPKDTILFKADLYR